jgi:hypothetical protein
MGDNGSPEVPTPGVAEEPSIAEPKAVGKESVPKPDRPLGTPLELDEVDSGEAITDEDHEYAAVISKRCLCRLSKVGCLWSC